MLLSITRRATSILSLCLPAALAALIAWALYVKLAAVEPPPASAQASNVKLAQAPIESAIAAAGAADAISNASIAPERAADTSVIAVGDTLKLAFYERLISEEDKWSARSFSKRPPVSFQQRTELSGDYDVSENGAVVLPLLGVFQVAGRPVAQFESEAKAAFESLIGRFAFMSVAVSRRPVYVVGPVKKPGAYKYLDGMTVLHVVALAGGFDRPAVEIGHMLEAVREAEKIQKAADKLKRLRAKLIVLEAERDGVSAAPTQQLALFASDAEAKKLIEAEFLERTLALQSRASEAEALATAVKSAKSQVKNRRAGQDQVQSSITVRADRIANLNKLGDRIGRPIRAQAEAELSDVRARMMDFSASADDAEVRLSKLLSEQATSKNGARVELMRQIADLQTQIADASSTSSASAGALDAMRAALVVNSDRPDAGGKFQIVRGVDSKRQTITVTGEELVNPGDLVRVLSDSDFVAARM